MGTGLVSTYDLPQGVIIDMDPLIRMLEPTEVPLQNGLGADGRTVLSTSTTFAKKVEWQDDAILTPRSTVAATATTGDTVLTVASGERLRFSTGDAILIGAEQVRVTGYGNTADTLLVARAHAGTTAGTVALSADMVNLGANLPEGSDPQNPRFQDRTGRYNLTQIFGPTSVIVSGTEQVVRKYGLNTTEFDYQMAMRVREELIKAEQAIIYGTRYDDTTNELRQMGGMTYFITTNVDSATTTVTEAKILDLIQNIWDDGGNPDRMLIGGVQKRKISDLSSDDIRLGRADVGRGQTVEYFDSDFGRVTFVLHRRMRRTDAILFEREQATVETLRPLQFKMLGDTGDSIKGMVVREITLKFTAERHAGRFSALT